MLGKFPIKTIFISFLIFLTFSVLSFLNVILSDYFTPVLAGFLLGLLNFSIEFLFLRKMKNRSFNKFFGLLVSGILLRLGLMLVMVFIALYFLELNPLSFIFSFLFFYFFFLINELFYLKSGKI